LNRSPVFFCPSPTVRAEDPAAVCSHARSGRALRYHHIRFETNWRESERSPTGGDDGREENHQIPPAPLLNVAFRMLH
jgi:hypothetical protein